MKIVFISVMTLFILLTWTAMAQQDSISWFSRNVTIGQSMATSESQALPAQFSVTFPQHKGSSWLINAGATMKISTKSPTKLSSITLEFHRNTLTDSVQNNLSAGYKGYFHLNSSINQNTYFLIVDPQFSLDQIKKTSSLQSNILISWRRKGSGLHVGIPHHHEKTYTLFNLVGGTQIQQVFANDTTTGFKGFKIRPLITGSYGYFFKRDRNDDDDPLIGLTASYTQRVASVNSSEDKERWSHQLIMAANYYVISKPAKVSIGLAFVNGSDNYTGLKQQQYFLLSLNILAEKLN